MRLVFAVQALTKRSHLATDKIEGVIGIFKVSRTFLNRSNFKDELKMTHSGSARPLVQSVAKTQKLCPAQTSYHR